MHNDASGWDSPENAAAAESSEPADISKIWGNFTKEELPENPGYDLVVGLGHSTDYNGYTVSYREYGYASRDSYRKALTAYGPQSSARRARRFRSSQAPTFIASRRRE